MLSATMVGRERCENLFPNLYDLLAEFPIPMQFSLQLFHHRNIPAYNYLFVRTYAASARTFALGLFAEHCSMNPAREEVYNLWLTLGEAWYSRLDPDDLSAETLQRHAQEILESLFRLMDSKLFAALHA